MQFKVPIQIIGDQLAQHRLNQLGIRMLKDHANNAALAGRFGM